MPLNKVGNTVRVLSYAAYMLIRLRRMSHFTETSHWLFMNAGSAETSHYNHFKKRNIFCIFSYVFVISRNLSRIKLSGDKNDRRCWNLGALIPNQHG